jgi:flagellar hook-associated protein 2
MGLRSDPVGGGQFKQAVQQIVEAEMQPVKQMQIRKSKEEAKLKLFQDFKNKFNGLDKSIAEIITTKKLRELKVDLGDGERMISATVDKERANPGKYLLEINALATRNAYISNGFENPDDPVLGAGLIILDPKNESEIEISIQDNASSLRGIASEINKNEKSPVNASVYQDDSDPDKSWKIMLVAKKEGEINNIPKPQFYFFDTDTPISIEDDHDAKNASISMDGFPIESKSNDINDFLTGVNLHLKQAKPHERFFLSISEDYQKMTTKVKNVVDQINQIFQFITSQNSLDERSDTSTTFGGDSSLQTIEYQLRNLVQKEFSFPKTEDQPETKIFLSKIGIEFERNGQLSFKDGKFNKMLEKDPAIITQILSGPTGFGSQLKSVYENYTKSYNGFLGIKEKGLKDRIKQIDEQIDKKMAQVERKKQMVTDQFVKLESTISAMQKQQQYLSATLGSSGGNSVAQLLG